MDLTAIWEIFFQKISSDSRIKAIDKKVIAGLPFVYVHTVPGTTLDSVTDALKENSVKAMKGKRLTLELIFVRAEENVYIFRMRFLVPQEKMFCCGNLCFDCIRLRSQ
jgi:hypothetical protein